jgi:hypothetical protein
MRPLVGTRESLEAALAMAAEAARAEGVELVVRTTVVENVEQAQTLGFLSSPTIRVNGRDIALEMRQSPCEPCGDLAGEPVDCRVWVYEGREHRVAPEAMIIEAVLREVRRPSPGGTIAAQAVRDNLRRFFARRAQGGRALPVVPTGCCGPASEGAKKRVSSGRCC